MEAVKMRKKRDMSSRNFFQKKLLASLIAAVCTNLVAISVSQASDIEIYQEAKSGQITLMFMIDVSGSMEEKDGGTQTRLARVKTAMQDLLNGNSAKKIEKISDDKVIGLSAYSRAGDNSRGYIIVPARRLNCQYGKKDCDDMSNNGKSQRTLLVEKIGGLIASGGTPTANAYAEVASYFMGTTTFDSKANDLKPYIVQENTSTYGTCQLWNGNICLQWARYSGFNSAMVEELIKGNETKFLYTIGRSTYYGRPYRQYGANGFSGFIFSDETSKDGLTYKKPASLQQSEDIKKCSGQGIYVLTDGAPNGNGLSSRLMKQALSTTTKESSFNCTDSESGWGCMHEFSKNLLESEKNPAILKIKTAVVGFGSDFNNVVSYNRNKTLEDNLKPFLQLDNKGNPKKDTNGEWLKRTNLTDVEAAAYWGIIGGGGWYSGSSSQDVVESINNFINDLSTEIPAVTTGSPTIPKDALNPAALQNDAYYQQFEPTPDKSYQLWLGNLKKYLVTTGGVLKDKNGNKIVDNDGKILDNYDYWAYPVDDAKKDADGDTPGSTRFALHGGVWSRLALRTDPVNNPANGTVQRKVLTNRIYLGGTGASSFGESSNNTLRQIKPTDLTDKNYKNDSNRGYLVRLLGYNIDAANPPNSTDTLKTAPEFRQIGAVMHSSPLLITNKGKVGFDSTTKTLASTDREDYILFGSTQGLLHVVKAGKSGVAGGGEEVFAFMPNEMVDRQKKAFEKPDATSGGTNNLFYGIDGPWTAYTEYVVDDTGNLTVGNGKGSQRGVQDVYGGLRMGGRSYYALDLRDMDDPKLKFHINPDAATTGPLSYMGESWSKPSIGFVNWDGKRTRVMFVGGGYDRIGGEDNQGYENPAYVQTNKVGAGVYMFRAEDEASPGTGKAGELLWWSSANATDKTTVPVAKKHDDMKYSVVSEIRTVDRDGDDLIDHIYFGDLGGQIFRVDFDNKQNTIASFAKKPVRIFKGNKASGKSPRFYDMPGFSLYNDSGTVFAIITQGSGNRSKPLFSNSTYDYDAVYNIYDKDVTRKDLYSAASWKTQDVEPDSSTGLVLLTEDDRKNDSNLKAPASSKGWYYEFKKCLAGYGDCKDYEQQTEKVFGTPVVLNNKMFVSTFDASKDGLAGDCGAGVKGASLMTTFCMPFGQCKASDVTGTTHSMIGAGIHTIAVGNDVSDGGGGNNGNNNGGGSGNNSEDNKSSASNYCISTGSRMTITVTGGASTGEQTRMCLIPQRWYEKLIKD